jgi:hypothetical protein
MDDLSYGNEDDAEEEVLLLLLKTGEVGVGVGYELF